jgi:hypothetical protein
MLPTIFFPGPLLPPPLNSPSRRRPASWRHQRGTAGCSPVSTGGSSGASSHEALPAVRPPHPRAPRLRSIPKHHTIIPAPLAPVCARLARRRQGSVVPRRPNRAGSSSGGGGQTEVVAWEATAAVGWEATTTVGQDTTRRQPLHRAAHRKPQCGPQFLETTAHPAPESSQHGRVPRHAPALSASSLPWLPPRPPPHLLPIC